MISPTIDFSPKHSTATSASFDEHQCESLNKSNETTFESNTNDSVGQFRNNTSELTSPERTSTPVQTEENEQHCVNELISLRPALSSGEKSPAWDQQQANINSCSLDDDVNDSEVRMKEDIVMESNLIYFINLKRFQNSTFRSNEGGKEKHLKQDKKERNVAKKLIKELASCNIILGEMEVNGNNELF